MRKVAISLFLMLFGITTSLFAQDYAAKVTVNSGNSFVVKKLNIQGDRLYQESGQSSTSLSMVKEIEFRFSSLSLGICERMFESGDRKALENLLNMNVGPVAEYSYLSTNLGEYLVWLLKTQSWNGNVAGMGKTIGQLRQTKNPRLIAEASLYFTMMLLDQGKVENAKTIFSSVDDPASISIPMTEYIMGKIALDEGDSRKAMQHVARIVAFHGRDAEWMPPATVLEARVYQMLGQPEKAQAVANELILAYPGTQWSRQGEAIMMETNGTQGG